MSAKRREINRITAVMREHDEQLSSYPNVVGFGVGYKVKGGRKLDQLAIIVFVKKKLPLSDLQRYEVIPANIREVLTDVQESGEIFAYQARTGKWRPAPPGVSIGHYLITAGTFGCVALKSGVRKILSNNHVLANSNSAFVGDAIYQPGVYDGGGPADTIALLEDWVPIVFSDTANNLVDAAIAAPINDDDILNEILDIGVPIAVVEAELDMSVVKSGRTTAVTYGTITAINATITVNYGASGLARFIDQIILTYMLAGGDSGSLLLTHPEHEAIGLIFAGSYALGVASRIQYAESLLGITILLDITDASVDLPAQFTVGRGQEDLYAKFDVGQGSAELFASFDGQVTQDLSAACFVVNPDSQDLPAEFEVGQGSQDLYAGFEVSQDSQELFGKTDVRHSDSADLVCGFYIPYKFLESVDAGLAEALVFGDTFLQSEDLQAQLAESITFFPIKISDSANVYAHFITGHVGSVELLAKFEVGQDSRDLFSKYIVRKDTTAELFCSFSSQASVDLPAEFVVKQWQEDLLGEFIIIHDTSVGLHGIFDGQAIFNLPAEFIVERLKSSDFLGEFSIRHESGIELPAVFEGQVSADLHGKFEIGQNWDDLPAEFTVGQDSIDLLGTFNIQLVVPYPYWTDRRLVNGVVELSEASISDAFLEEIIGGVMDDIKTWLIANEVATYTGWTNIEEAPLAIQRATTYGTVASMYARRIFSPHDMVVRVAPMDVKVITTHESAMEYWEDKMDEALENYLTSVGRVRIWVDTIDEDPKFTMDDVPHDPKFTLEPRG